MSRNTESTSPPEKVGMTTFAADAKVMSPLPPLQATIPANPLLPPLTKTASAPERGSSETAAVEEDTRAMAPPSILPPRATMSLLKPPPPPAAPTNNPRPPSRPEQPQQQRRGIVVTHSSNEYETTDDESDEESGSWASEDMSADENAPATTTTTATNRNSSNLSRNPSHPNLTRTTTHNNSRKTTAQKLEEARIREAFAQAEREREMFAKQPKPLYSNLNRTQSGLLSALLNPDPTLFPEKHPVRVKSSADVSGASGLGRMTMTMGQARAPVQAGPSRPPMAMPTLSTSKSVVALPVAAQVTAQTPKTNGAGTSPHNDRQNANAAKDRYQPKGCPQDQELDSDSETDAESPSNLSRSRAHEKLAALAADNNFRRRHSDHPTPSTAKPPRPSDHPLATRPTLPTVATAPIPLNHPWNLPMTAAAPSTPRTTRRQMMSTEISESVRRNLLWERQANKPQVGGLTKRSMSTAGGMTGMTGGVLGGGLMPLTSTTSQLGRKRDGQGQQPQGEGQDKGKGRADGEGVVDEEAEREYNERKKKAMARNRTWADDYHYSGW